MVIPGSISILRSSVVPILFKDSAATHQAMLIVTHRVRRLFPSLWIWNINPLIGFTHPSVHLAAVLVRIIISSVRNVASSVWITVSSVIMIGGIASKISHNYMKCIGQQERTVWTLNLTLLWTVKCFDFQAKRALTADWLHLKTTV